MGERVLVTSGSLEGKTGIICYHDALPLGHQAVAILGCKGPQLIPFRVLKVLDNDQIEPAEEPAPIAEVAESPKKKPKPVRNALHKLNAMELTKVLQDKAAAGDDSVLDIDVEVEDPQ